MTISKDGFVPNLQLELAKFSSSVCMFDGMGLERSQNNVFLRKQAVLGLLQPLCY